MHNQIRLFLLRQEKEQAKREVVRWNEHMMSEQLVPFDAQKGTSYR